MTGASTKTKPEPRRQPVSGAIPTPGKEKKMSTTVQQDTEKVTPQQQEVIDRLDALDPGDSVKNGVAWYENAGPGLWSTDADSKSTEVFTSRQIVLAATEKILVDRASQSIALPPAVAAPNLARFNALADTENDRPWLLKVGEKDPAWDGTCPSWCVGQAAEQHLIDERGYTEHRSRPIPVGMHRARVSKVDNGAHLRAAHFEIAMAQGVTDLRPVIEFTHDSFRGAREVGAWGNWLLGNLYPGEARELAEALLAAADLADPDGEFEAAGR